MRVAPASVAAAALVASAAGAAKWRDLSVPAKAEYTTRSDCAFDRCGSKLCLLGGRNELPGEVVKPASVFDTAAGTWEDGAEPPLGIHHFQIAQDPEDAAGDCVWAGGAFQGNFPAEDIVENVYKFCADSGKWSKGPKIDRPRGSGGAVTYDGKYYLVGGNVGGHGAQADVKPWFDVYDPKSKKWAKLANIPNPRDHFSAAVLKDKLYVAGGRDTGVKDFFNAVEAKVDVYDFKSEKWSTLDKEYPAPRGGTLAAKHGDMIVYGGGEGFGDATDEVFFFDGKTFTEGPPMLTPHHGTGFASCGGALWVAGGVAGQADAAEISSTEVLYAGDGDAPECTAKTADSPSVTQAALLGDDEDGDAKADSTSGDDEETCFPASATVQLQSGAAVAMEDLRVGDRVRVSGGGFSDVYFFSHKDANAAASFVRIATEAASLSLTPGHLLRVNGKLAPADTVRVGDELDVAPAGRPRAGRAVVVKVDAHQGRGLYNPHTVHGDVVVDGVVTSCLTTALPEAVATALLAPFKAVYAAIGAHPVVFGINEAVLVGLQRLDKYEVSVARAVRMLAGGLGAFRVKSEL